MNATFDTEEKPAVKQRDALKEGAACVYFGAERLAELRKVARRQKVKLSPLVSTLVDGGLFFASIAPETLSNLSTLAKLRGVTPEELFSKLVKEAIARI